VHAEKPGADRALMLYPHGFPSTTSACSVFGVRAGEAWTSAGENCMQGIIRSTGSRWYASRERSTGLSADQSPAPPAGWFAGVPAAVQESLRRLCDTGATHGA
jgi:hypothetical protein